MPPSDNPTAVREKLAESLDQAHWDWIKPHADRDRVIVVAPELTLLTVGEAVAQDQAQQIEAWIVGGKLAKPSQDQLAAWNGEPKRLFMCLVVDPYVLIQVLQPSSDSRTLH